MIKDLPLATYFRPKTLSEFVGQEKIISDKSWLYQAIKSDKVPSLIFWGPPGVGKTTLARIYANSMGADYYEDRGHMEGLAIGIGDGTSIDKAIVDKNARIGKNVTIRNMKKLKNFDGENYFIRDGIVIIPKNAIIKSNTKI